MFFDDNDNLYYTIYGAFAIIIVMLHIMGVKLPSYTWPIYGLIGVLLAIFDNYIYKL